jgi:hypothetical protein
VVKARLTPQVYQTRFSSVNTNANANANVNVNVNNDDHPKHPPILGMYSIHRHYENFAQVDQLWDVIPWSTKKDTIIWRGSTAGTRSSTGGPRKQVVEHYFDDKNGKDIDVGFSYTLEGHDHLKKYIRPELSVRQLLSYKYLLSLEGWGLASGLKWMLYSNSVVFMAAPTKVSWAMEDKLVPYVHYIPLKPDYSDLRQQLEWARNHDEECQTISRQARSYMEHLVTSPEAQSNTLRILKDMGRIYQRNFGSTLETCNISKA